MNNITTTPNTETPSKDFHAAFVLHTRAYRDTSLLVDLLTKEEGRISVVARGAKRPKSAWKGLLQPFIPVLVRYVGKHDLKTLCDADSRGYPLYFSGIRLWCGLYINELLTRILHGHDPCPIIFDLYETTIRDLHDHHNNEAYILRRFEKDLLKALGYDITMMLHISEEFTLDPAAYYHYLPEHGLSLVKSVREHDRSIFLGKDLLAIAQDDFSADNTLRAAKRLFRLAFSPLLGSKMLNSYKILIPQE